MRLCGAAAVCFLLAGCGRYSDFTLPAPSGSPRAVKPEFKVDPKPVMEPAPGWESVDVLNPSVVEHRGKLVNVYSAYDGKVWHTGVAESTDGLRWEGRRRVLSPPEGGYIAANGTALSRNGELLYWY